MNLDDLSLLRQIDTQNMLAEIDHLPGQLEQAWALGQTLPLPSARPTIRNVVLSGMGGSAIGADLVAAYAAAICPVPVFVHRDYGLPAFAKGPETLFIASSHSGNTEETLDAFEQALQAGCNLIAISTGGELAEKASAAGIPLWKFEHTGQARAAVGYSFGLLLAAFSRLGLLPDQSELLAGAVTAMQQHQADLRAEVPAALNPGKRYAGQLMGRWVTIFGSELFAPVARRWKTQINELAKAPASFEILPEANHNTLAGFTNPADVLMSHTISMFLTAPADHPRNRLRSKLTRKAFMLEGGNTDVYLAKGDSPLAQMWTAIHFGDYLAYYLAIAYQIDPTPVAALEELKAALSGKK